jgi:hypothetical protein
MKIVQEQISPDGTLRLVVTRNDDGDVAIGFDKYAWHTHADILASVSGLSEDDAIRQLVQRITGDNQILVVSRIDGEVREVWPTDDPQAEVKYKPPEESLEFRRWSGVTVNVSAS